MGAWAGTGHWALGNLLPNGFVGVNRHAGTGPAMVVPYVTVVTRICSAGHFYFRGSRFGAYPSDGHVPWFC